MKTMPSLPPRPAALSEIEARRAAVRREARAVETEIQRIQDERWNAAHGDKNLDRAAELMAAGEIEVNTRDTTPERIEELRARLQILERANRKITERVAREREKYNHSIARALRPAHREVAQRIYKALVELVAANETEERLRALAPGVGLRPVNFPNVGRFGPHGEPAQTWKNYALREGLLAEGEGETRFPAAAF